MKNHSNQQYSILAISNASGAVVERIAYQAYGQPTFTNAAGTTLSSSAKATRYSYTGREWDASLELHHFRARWMSGVNGRFLTRDPIGYAGGVASEVSDEEMGYTGGNEEFGENDGMSLYGNYFALRGFDPTGMVATCVALTHSSGKGHPASKCLRWRSVNGKVIKKTCVRLQCFFRCYCPDHQNCRCSNHKCEKDHGTEIDYVSTEKDRGLLPWLLNTGAPRCELLTGTIADTVEC